MRCARFRVGAELHAHRALYQRALLSSGAHRMQSDDHAEDGVEDSSSQSPEQAAQSASWRLEQLASLQRLYPPVRMLAPTERHKLLFSADPILP